MNLKYLLDILFPRTCMVCHSPLKEDEVLCPVCLGKLERTEQAFIRDNETEKFMHHSQHFLYGGCWLHYWKGSYLQHIIHRAKFGNGNPMLWQQLGRQAAMEWQETGFFDGVDLLVPIPLYKKRFRSRGFNQSEWICKGLSEVLKIPMDTTHLTRKMDTKHQSLSTFDERLVGVKNSFGINHPEEWYRRTIMLVDDIITTGATMRAAMDAMKDVYACRIVAFGIAKTK